MRLTKTRQMIKTLNLAGRTIETNRAAFVMGIVNATPDSFYEGSRGGIERALLLVKEGCDILDIGGESTRPSSRYVDEEEEIRRVIPLVREVRKACNVPISIDTRKSAVLKAALDEGADMLNDVSALEDDKDIVNIAAKREIPVILMHKRGIPAIMQEKTGYEDIFLEVSDYLNERAKRAVECGVAGNRIIVDPGIGFGKDDAGNAVLIKRCGELCGGKYPVLIGVSRKSSIGRVTGRDEGERAAGSIAAVSVAAMMGASIVRVHDVKESIDAMRVVTWIKGGE